MDEGINVILLEELFDAHGSFENIISEMKENGIIYPYDNVIKMEDASYRLCFNSIDKMNESQQKYNYLKEENKDFYTNEKKIGFKYLLLYVTSFIMIKIFSNTLSVHKINEIWYALLGLTLGTVSAGIINRNINEYRYGNKDNRKFMIDLIELQETYDENFEIARREVSYIYSLNRNLLNELPENKKFIKK